MSDVLLAGGLVADAESATPRQADVRISAGRIDAVAGPGLLPRDGAAVIDCTGRVVLPGFIDTHSHADAMVFDSGVQHALLRQGVTTIIAGQDGVSYAPGDGSYAAGYFAALLGPHPSYQGGVAGLLAGYGARVRLNVAYLVPHGTVRHEVMGLARRAPTDPERRAMRELVRRGLDEGAVGLSTGLDYVPGMFADARELAFLCQPVAEADGVYVTHMRGGYEHNSRAGVDEVRAICRASGARGHISHFHGPASLVTGLLAEAAAEGIPLTFDAYPYRAAFTLLSMPVLPADLLALGPRAAGRRLRDPRARADLLRDALPAVADRPGLGPGWAARVTLAHVGSPDYAWAAGLTVEQASARAGTDPAEFVLDILAASDLAVSAVMPLPPGRTVEELAAICTHEAHMLGTDGIYLGERPHPRGWGGFTRFIARHLRERGDLGWPEVAAHLSSSAAVTFRLGDRGLIRPGYIADLAVADPAAVSDQATYQRPRAVSSGIADVLVAGVPVLRDGELTADLPGRGLRRQPPGHHG